MESGICFACWQKLNFTTEPMCYLCGTPFVFYMGEQSVCAVCAHRPLSLQKLRSVWVYDDASRHLILRFKTGGQRALGPMLGRCLMRIMAPLKGDIDWIVPVPLHLYRLWHRGFNQSALLAQCVSRQTGIDYRPLCLKRFRHTASQGSLHSKERFLNVKSAFCVPHRWKKSLKGKRILLVDDVYTTGATLQSCAQVLHQAGAASVSAVTLARTIKPEDITLRYGARASTSTR